ncbi:MAG TPA: AccI family restriction endonuclease [Smithellaceae bacterium]|jgi:type II restriction enzyme|nr:AccI family restriction endonuclease [Candidatus Moranbacteria bacterium]HNZ89242.1 AccI family restriction endonuclease [Candidatus Cloacimonas acidaminovorans]HPY36169.1 AccI family restriction endonuclease [Smithellaceae bacterium]HQK91691.1 AccI family restriction endonuclease [Smithellaceae bacterium]
MYKDDILKLINQSPLDIDTELQLTGRPPTMASSEFLTNKEQGDWAERIVFKAINEFSKEYFAFEYGRSESIAAGDDGFSEFYLEYQNELNAIGKRPDLLIFKVSDFPDRNVDIENDEHIRRAVAALEVRSSSFLAGKYTSFMRERQQQAIRKCSEIRNVILNTAAGSLLERKNETIYNLITNATDDTFRELDFRSPSWSLTQDLRNLTILLKDLKENIKILHKRDYLSITPKMEDIALVNRWIQNFNIRHFYLQVFFDKAYIISFKDILELVSNDNNDGNHFSIERDVKNQGKTTIKINVQVGKEILGRIDMPEHQSAMKELDRGRLLFYVTFAGGRGYLDNDVFIKDIINA